MTRDRLALLLERQKISGVLHRYATGVDARDWVLFRSCFDAEVEVDLSSWNGMPPAKMDADAWVAGVRSGLSGFDATQHISANHLVEFHPIGQSTPDALPDRARCTSYMQASHALDGERVVLGGHYVSDLRRIDDTWCIAKSQLVVTWRSGPESLFARAAARFQARPGDA